jgi:hypothetical protein
MGAEVDYQVAASAEMSTPNLHRAKIAQKECGWKDGDRGGSTRMQSNPQRRRKKQKEKNTLTGKKNTLALTGLLMEGLEANTWEPPPKVITKH